jgi:NADPH-dependent F420 reductase
MEVAIIGGTGAQGFGVAARLATAGRSVVVGSREQARARDAVVRLEDVVPGSAAIPMTNQEAAGAADVVVVTVPFAGHAAAYRSMVEHLRPDAVVLDATSPLATAVGGAPTEVLRPWHGSAAEQAAAICGDRVHVVSGLHTIAASSLIDLGTPVSGDVLLAGDDADAKAVIGDLLMQIPDLGWVDCGALSAARIIEPMTALLIGVNRRYGRRDAGVRMTGPSKESQGWGRP